jgi:hypothetical protein
MVKKSFTLFIVVGRRPTTAEPQRTRREIHAKNAKMKLRESFVDFAKYLALFAVKTVAQ